MSRKPEDLTNQWFHRLVVREYAGHDESGRSQWLCECDCGATKIVSARHLKFGDITSCGCVQRENGQRQGTARFTHGHSPNNHIRQGKGSRAYNTWRCMRRRCDSPNNSKYASYGGRGIKVCDRWYVFQNFLTDMGEPPEGHTLHRLDHDGDYEPSNCEWRLRGKH